MRKPELRISRLYGRVYFVIHILTAMLQRTWRIFVSEISCVGFDEYYSRHVDVCAGVRCGAKSHEYVHSKVIGKKFLEI